MTMSHVVSGLLEKRAELAGLIRKAQRDIARMKAELGHLDGAIRIFAPELPASAYRSKEIRNRPGHFKTAELSRFVLDQLRDAPGGLTMRELTDAAMVKKGLDPADSAPWQAVSRRVDSYLRKQKGELVEVVTPGERPARWRVVEKF